MVGVTVTGYGMEQQQRTQGSEADLVGWEA